MAATIKSLINSGGSGTVVDVECHLSNGLPNLIIVGLATKAVDESKERVRGAFYSCGIELPRKRITINLAPADVPKDSAVFDLPVALSIMCASQQIANQPLPSCAVFGELGLDGGVRPVRGIIGLLIESRKKGFSDFLIPAANLSQAKLVPNISITPIKTLKEAYLHLTDTKKIPSIYTDKGLMPPAGKSQVYHLDFNDIIGQKRAKRALEISAAGSHNVHLSGPPGTGKSMLAKALPSILPSLSLEEILEITHTHSLATRQYEQLVTERPFRAPHHSSSQISIVGGGQNPRPGEVSLSHKGVLYFDEFPEFNRSTIEALRQPLEDKYITVARAKDSVTFPADFILVATSNPCPCGYYGSEKPCVCLPGSLVKYQQKLSGPIIDRIDMHIEVDSVEHKKLLAKDGAAPEESSSVVRKRVNTARERQLNRYYPASLLNGNLSNRDIKKYLDISDGAKKLLDQAADTLKISARSYMRLIKVAQTIADLAEEDRIFETHISEALQYRPKTQAL